MKNQSVALVILTIVLWVSCAEKKPANHVLKIKGSESMHETFTALKAAFERTQDSITVVLEGGGSRTGLMAIKDNTAQIGLSSYQFKLNEVLGENHQVNEQVVAYDGIVVINNQANPVHELTDKQIQGIFSGRITDWSELGGEPGPVVPIIRDQNSGTQKFFTQHFNIAEPVNTAIVAEDNPSIVKNVKLNTNAIGFIGFSYFAEQINSIKIQNEKIGRTDSLLYVEPTYVTLETGDYPLRRSLQIYYRENEPATRSFLQYLNSQDARSVIEMHGMLANKADTKLISRR